MSDPRPQPSAERIRKVSEAAARWQQALVDTTGRNRLRRYRDLRRGTLDLTSGRAVGLDEQALDRLLAGRGVTLSDLFPIQQELFGAAQDDDPLPGDGADPREAFEDARRRFALIHKTALANHEEKGIDTCFAAIGLATWRVAQGPEPNAPVILLPLTVRAAGAASRDFTIEVVGDAHLSPVLIQILESEHGIDTESAEAALAEEPPTNLEAVRALLERFGEAWSILPELAIEARVVIANFSYSTMPLVADLKKSGELLAANDIVAAIAGDGSAHASLRSRVCEPAFSQPDLDPPGDEFLPLDADSSQHLAINRALGGESLVIQGPPGTGKSQTIANLIAALIAQGKRVLFVAEKRAAIEAVTKRLRRVGLDDLVMDMHGGVTSRREFARTLADTLDRVARIPAPDFTVLHQRLQERRDALNANAAALHEARSPWRLCVFHMRERTLAIPEAARADRRLTREAARALDSNACALAGEHAGDDLPREPGAFERLTDEIREWIDLDGHRLAEDHPEWSGSRCETTEEARRAYDLVRDLARERLPAAREALGAVLGEAGLPLPDSVGAWAGAARFLVAASGSRWARLRARLFSAEFRAMRRRLGANGAVSVSPEKARAAETRARELRSGLEEFGSSMGMADLARRPHEELASLLERLAASRAVAASLPRVRDLEARFREAGIADLTAQAGKAIAPEHTASAVEYAWLSRVLDDLAFDDPLLSTFEREAHARCRDEFAESDRRHLQSAPERLRRLHAETVIAAMNANPDEEKLIRREAAKKRRHLSVRRLFADAPHVLSALRPCWTMSPILTAEMIPADSQLFDVVIFDEASQIPPANAIGSLARAPQAVIAGDSRQLPPTSFFGARAGDEDEPDDADDDDQAPIDDIESVLDLMGALLRNRMLQWHYRSRDDRLIGFSNRHIYGGALTAFPGTQRASPISHCLVPFRADTSGSGTRSHPDEVQKVVELVLEHARETPGETLGVIAFGQHHADNIEMGLRLRLGELNDPALDEFFDETNEERFFVKNIERVQGDERDAIILSVGYHKSANGRLAYRFGPLNQEGGERRLNVAVTRARSRITLVSSFSHRDMDPGRSTSEGVRLLRRYLEYADSGGTELGAEVADIALNPFELSIKEGLERRGVPVTPQYGVSGYRIDFACAHPEERGRMVLAVEADGASYHSSHTARDRDRLRQQVLEDKGWRFHRIWSTAWFRDREAELDRAEAAWKRAVREADRGGGPSRRAPTPPAPEAASTRGPRPRIPSSYDTITDYSDQQLEDVVRWIESDTLLRTDRQLMEEMREALGFQRIGSRIRKRFTRAIAAARGGT